MVVFSEQNQKNEIWWITIIRVNKDTNVFYSSIIYSSQRTLGISIAEMRHIFCAVRNPLLDVKHMPKLMTIVNFPVASPPSPIGLKFPIQTLPRAVTPPTTTTPTSVWKFG